MTWSRHRPRVLVLEDEPAEARLVERILEDEGFDVETVDTGEEALGRLAVDRYCPYELLVLDLRMAGLGGLHVVRYVLHHRRDLLDRVMIVSSASPREHPGMVGNAAIRIPWILKPYRPADLVALARELVENVGSTAPAWLSFRN